MAGRSGDKVKEREKFRREEEKNRRKRKIVIVCRRQRERPKSNVAMGMRKGRSVGGKQRTSFRERKAALKGLKKGTGRK